MDFIKSIARPIAQQLLDAEKPKIKTGLDAVIASAAAKVTIPGNLASNIIAQEIIAALKAELVQVVTDAVNAEIDGAKL